MKRRRMMTQAIAVALVAGLAAGQSGPKESFFGERGDFSSDAPLCTVTSAVGAHSPLGACHASRRTGFPNQCRVPLEEPARSLAAGSTVTVEFQILDLLQGTCGFMHLAAEDLMEPTQWINLRGNGGDAFCLSPGAGPGGATTQDYSESVTVVIPPVKAGRYHVCWYGAAGVAQTVDSGVSDTSSQFSVFHACSLFNITNAALAPGNFATTPVYVVDFAGLFTGDLEDTVVALALDGFSHAADALGAQQLAFLASKVQEQGPVAYCQADGRLHASASALGACEAPLHVTPNVRPNACDAFAAAVVQPPTPSGDNDGGENLDGGDDDNDGSQAYVLVGAGACGLVVSLCALVVLRRRNNRNLDAEPLSACELRLQQELAREATSLGNAPPPWALNGDDGPVQSNPMYEARRGK